MDYKNRIDEEYDGLEEELDEVWEEINGLRERVLQEGTFSKKQLCVLCEKLEDIWAGLYEAHLALFPLDE